MSGQTNRSSRLRLQFFQKFGGLILLLLFVLDYNTSQNQASTSIQKITYPEAVASLLQIFSRDINLRSVGNPKLW